MAKEGRVIRHCPHPAALTENQAMEKFVASRAKWLCDWEDGVKHAMQQGTISIAVVVPARSDESETQREFKAIQTCLLAVSYQKGGKTQCCLGDPVLQ